MFNKDKVAEPSEFVAGIGDCSCVGGFDRGAQRRFDVDAVIIAPFGNRAEVGNDFSLYRPCEFGRSFFTVVVVVRVVFFLAAEIVFFWAELAFQEEAFDAVAAFLAVVGVVELLTTEPGITSLCPILRA